MIRTKYQATEFFKPIYDELQTDKSAGLSNGVAFMGRYAYLVGDLCCGRLAVYDSISSCKVFWDYDEEIATNLSDSVRDRIRGYQFTHRGDRVLFLRKKDIASVIPRLTPFKKSRSELQFRVTQDTVEMQAVKQGMILQRHVAPKNFSSTKKLRDDEGFVGNFSVNLLYFEKMSLENFSESGIIGLRLSEHGDAVQIFISGPGRKLDWILRLQ